MPFKIAVASGKGGTGKTTVSVNLFHHIVGRMAEHVQLIDCDVEEPNVHVFFPKAQYDTGSPVFQMIPSIDPARCTYCRKCVEYCEFNAIVVIPPVQFAEVNKSLCHSCGACIVACEANAIRETLQEIGTIRHSHLQSGGYLTEGRLRIGSAMQTMVIRKTKETLSGQAEVVIFDAPPGTSCPVVATVADADYIVLVTEPTPFGLHDLKLTLELLKKIDRPFGVIINKSDLGNDQVKTFLKHESIELLGEIPFSREYAGVYASGTLFEKVPEEIATAYSEILRKLRNKIPE
jgi:MinD superfamily P-loop ATPase